jgi:hypothetical protein
MNLKPHRCQPLPAGSPREPGGGGRLIAGFLMSHPWDFAWSVVESATASGTLPENASGLEPVRSRRGQPLSQGKPEHEPGGTSLTKPVKRAENHLFPFIDHD